MFKEIEKYIEDLEDPREDILEVLLAAQGYYGKLTDETIEYIGKLCNMSVEEIRETVEFFPFLIGDRKRVEVCKGFNCSIKGADHIEAALLEEDGRERIDLIETPCRGRCKTAPNIWIDDIHYPEVNPDKLEKIIEEVLKIR